MGVCVAPPALCLVLELCEADLHTALQQPFTMDQRLNMATQVTATSNPARWRLITLFTSFSPVFVCYSPQIALLLTLFWGAISPCLLCRGSLLLCTASLCRFPVSYFILCVYDD